MNDFAALFFQLDQTNKTNDKVGALETFLLKASPADRIWMIALFTGRQPKRVISSRYLKEWVIEKAGLPEWLFEETYHVIGDLAETLALLLPPPLSTTSYSLSEWMIAIQALSQQSLSQKKETLSELWNHLHPKERLVFNKILAGGFRLGVSQNLLVRALSNAFNIEPDIIAHRLMGEWDPVLVDPDFLLAHTPHQMHAGKPYPFCLAYPLDVVVEELGDVQDWFAEYKWDGIRGQLVFRSETFTLWSRGEEIVQDRFPELTQLKDVLPKDIVIDGEILAHQGEAILPFQSLQQRIGRKKITPAVLKQIPVFMMAYDLLEYQGQDIRSWPFQERRKMLEKVLSELPPQSLIRLSPQIQAKSWDGLRQIRQACRENNSEGIMLKKLDSIYHVGRKRGDWWKWKVESYTVDGVLLYAQKGHGWRANVYSDYTFAVWEQDRLIPFAKAYSGLTKKELAEVDRFIKANTIEKFGPVRSVKPALVFEIAFEGIQFSKRHKSGVAVRFPRIQRWRKDKKPEEADTLETLRALIFNPE